ncbi:hypothetical protein EPIR_3763 [Erwinia piriflorinigrans CFBP 5888]|uniref:Uncharacterized protein n=1 Tax=Erwinia piriflorinigrans CFBP 5888 TaxID=1161919 RepID=V5ZDH8_9GAMM|nr:hypothetical protein EPIR_3763 [Erwinia piriflorinigrans CFBP 5888]
MNRKIIQKGYGAHAGARIIRRPLKSARIAQDLNAIRRRHFGHLSEPNRLISHIEDDAECLLRKVA